MTGHEADPALTAQALVAAIARLQAADLDRWVGADLVAPHQGRYSDRDRARVRLLCTLHYDLDLDADTLPLVVSLIDRLHATQARLGALTAAVAAQPPGVRQAILDALGD